MPWRKFEKIPHDGAVDAFSVFCAHTCKAEVIVLIVKEQRQTEWRGSGGEKLNRSMTIAHPAFLMPLKVHIFLPLQPAKKNKTQKTQKKR